MPKNNYIYYLLLALVIFMTVKNFIQLKRLSKEKKFTVSYAKVLRGDEDALDTMKAYLENEKNLDYKNEALLVEAYQEMVEGKDPYKAIDDIDFGAILTDQKGFSQKKLEAHSDLFVWLNLVCAKARNLSMIDIIETLYDKVTKYDEYLNNRLEYLEFKSICESLLEKKGDELAYLKKILDGDYAGVSHDKRLIGLYKRIASCFLTYAGETIDEFFENDLHTFAETAVGRHLLESLELFEKYKPDEETVEEPKEENLEVEENKEEVKEEENK